MGKIVHIELKVYAEESSDLKNDIIQEINRLFHASSKLLLSSIKSVQIIEGINIDLHKFAPMTQPKKKQKEKN